MSMILYHVSNPFFRDKISKEGLIPKIGDSYEAHYEDNHMGPVVFVSTVNDYDSTYDDDRYMIELTDDEFKSLNFKEDKEASNALYTASPISTKHLVLIHKGTGADYNWSLDDTCNNISEKPNKKKKKKSSPRTPLIKF